MSFDSHLRWRIQMMLPCPEAPSVVFLLCSPICPLLLIYFLISAWPCLTKSVLPETGDRNQREGQLWLIFIFQIWNELYSYMQLEIAIPDMHLLCNSIFCECHNGLPGLVVFTNFCQFCCRTMLQARAILKPADLDNNLYFSSFSDRCPALWRLHQQGRQAALPSQVSCPIPAPTPDWILWSPLWSATDAELHSVQCTPSKFMRAFYLKLSIFCSGSLPAIYEPFSLNIRVLEGLGYHIGVAVKCCDYISFSPFFCYAPPLSQYHNNYFS